MVTIFLPKLAFITKIRKKIKIIELTQIEKLKIESNQNKKNYEKKLKENFKTNNTEYKKLMTNFEELTRKKMNKLNNTTLLTPNQLYVNTLINLQINTYITTKKKI